ncbi:hypothetical protein, partial [Haemophilus influenzae]|uniref:hypothetical protein n=1 Tax=Haemophilus influenzae TaxID=727 RepID=UPI001C633755
SLLSLVSFIARYSVFPLPFTRSYWSQAELNFLSIKSSIFTFLCLVFYFFSALLLFASLFISYFT